MLPDYQLQNSDGKLDMNPQKMLIEIFITSCIFYKEYINMISINNQLDRTLSFHKPKMY